MKKIQYSAAAFLLLCSHVLSVYSQTQVSGTLSQSTTWTLQNSPYLVTGTVMVGTGTGAVTLTIEPGVEIRFNQSTSLAVKDHLVAQGTEANPILFTNYMVPPSSWRWNGINFGVAGTGVLSNCIVEYAANGIYSSTSNINIQKCTIRNNTMSGIYCLYGGSIKDCIITNNRSDNGGIGLECHGSAIIDSCSITQNSKYGVYFKDDNGSPILRNCTIANNNNYGTAFGVYGDNSAATINSCTINQNDKGLFWSGSAFSPNIIHNTITNSTFSAFIVDVNVNLNQFSDNIVSGNTGNYIELQNNQLTVSRTLPSSIGAPIYAKSGIIVGTGTGAVTLSIEPGVEIRFNQSTSLAVKDHLVAQGTEANPILFTNYMVPPSAWRWNGINFGVAGTGVLSNCIVEYAANGIYSSTSNINIQKCTIRNNTMSGIYCLYGGSIKDCIITNNRSDNGGRGIECHGPANIKNCTITLNSRDGIYGENSSATIDSCIISQNGTGIYWNGSASSPAFTHNRIINNTGSALIVDANVGLDQMSGNTVSGNTGNYIELNNNQLSVSRTWNGGMGIPILTKQGYLTIGSGDGSVTLTIEPGVEMRFIRNTSIVNVGFCVKDKLIAQGSEANPILFKCHESNPVVYKWKGINLDGSSVASLSHCIVENAETGITCNSSNAAIQKCTVKNNNIGISSKFGALVKDCVADHNLFIGIACYGPSTVEGCTISYTQGGNTALYGVYCRDDNGAARIKKCSIINNPDYGIYGDNSSATVDSCVISQNGKGIQWTGSASSPAISNNTISSNTVSAFVMNLAVDAGKISNNIASGNGNNYLEVGSGQLNVSRSWSGNPGMPYLVQSGSITIGGGNGAVALNIMPGAQVRFGQSKSIIINDRLNAQGTDKSPIVFTSNLPSPVPGNWAGISFRQNSAGTLAHCVIEYGGSVSLNNSSVMIQNSIVRKSGSHGLWLCNSNAEVTGNEIVDNNTGIYIDGSSGAYTIRNNQIQGNQMGVNYNMTNMSVIMDFRYNYWGHPSGPNDPSDDRISGGFFNPAGLGDDVCDHILYVPWTNMQFYNISELFAGITRTDTLKPGNACSYIFKAQRDSSILVKVKPKDNCIASMMLMEKFGNNIVQTRTSRDSYELLIPESEQKTYEFIATGRNGCSEGGPYEITASYVSRPYISDIYPKTTTQDSAFTLTIAGLNLLKETDVRLSAPGIPNILSGKLNRYSQTQLYAEFDLADVQTGIYDVALEDSARVFSILEHALEIRSSASPGHLSVSVEAPELVRASRIYTVWIKYKNIGGSSLPAPLLSVSNNLDMPMKFHMQTGHFQKGRLLMLAIGQEGSAGILTPGSEYRIPIDAQIPTEQKLLEYNQTHPHPPARTPIAFNVEKVVADQTPVSWDSLQTATKPDDVDGASWDIVFNQLEQNIGNTWQDLAAALTADAEYLKLHYRSAGPTLAGSELYFNKMYDPVLYDFNSLLGFEFSRVLGALHPRQMLSAAEDMSLPATGLALSFSRFAPQAVLSRFHPGSLGRGWYHSYEIFAQTGEDGSVTIKKPGDMNGRTFVKLSEGVYKNGAGEYAKLTVEGANYALREPDGIRFYFDRNNGGRLSLVSDPNNNQIRLVYLGNLLSDICNTGGDTLHLFYNAQGRISELHGPANLLVQYRYDASGEHLIEVEKNGGVITAYSYQPNDGTLASHALKQVVFPDLTSYHYQYDTGGFLIEEYAGNELEKSTYALTGRGTVRIETSNHAPYLVHYGPGGQILEMTDPLGNTLINHFNQNKVVSKVTRPDLKTGLVAYDNSGNQTGFQNPMGQLVKTSYDLDSGNLNKITDARNNAQNYQYDASGNMTRIVYPDSTAESFQYDPAGNMIFYQNRRLQTIQYVYNSRGQVTRKIYPDGKWLHYQYDNRGNCTAAADSVTGTILMQYDDRDFMTRIEYPGGYWLEFENDNTGKRTQRRDYDGDVLNYTYDSDGRLETMTDKNGDLIVHYDYDSEGRIAVETKGNGARTTNTYDLAGQLLDKINYGPSNNIQSRFQYTYDKNNNRTTMTTLEGTTSYLYDDIGQLIKTVYPDGKTETFTYDAAGNMLQTTLDTDTTRYVTNIMNHYIASNKAIYQYDEDGSLIFTKEGNDSTYYFYDFDNRLVGIQKSNGDIWQYIYDALGNRIGVKHNRITKKNIFDPIGMTNLVVELNQNGNVIGKYIHATGLISKEDSLENNYYYHFDGLGNTIQIINQYGNIENIYFYLSFGKLTSLVESIENSYTFSGEFGIIRTNGLLFMRNRYYCTDFMRFFNQDPIGINGGLNLYSYARNNPINYFDPLGLQDLFNETVREQRRLATIYTGMNSNNRDNPNNNQGQNITTIITPADKKPKTFNDYARELEEKKKEEIRKLQEFAKGATWEKYQLQLTPFPLRMRGEIIKSDTTDGVLSWDPNEKTAPDGVGDMHYVVQNDEMQYTINFENMPTAGAPAQEVYVHDYLDSTLNFSTFQFGEIGFGNRTVGAASGSVQGKERVVLDSLVVDVEAQFDSKNGYVFWHFKTLDPETGDYPENALAGFLPPNDATGRGQGYVTFKIKTHENLASGTVVRNKAKIIFDTNTPVETNEVFNTITSSPPGQPSNPGIPDDTTGVSIAAALTWGEAQYATSYDVFLWNADYPKPSHPYAADLTSASFDASSIFEYNRTYNWQVAAKNVIGSTAGPVWSFTIENEPSYNRPPTLTDITAQTVNEGDTLTVSVSAADPDGDAVTLQAANLPAFASFADNTDGTGSIMATPRYNEAGNYPNIRIIASDGSLADTVIFTITVNNINLPPLLTGILDQTVDEGDTLNIAVQATDDDGDALTLSGEGLPAFAVMTDNGNGTGVLAVMPGFNHAGVYSNVRVIASDGALADTMTFTITVNNVNRPPQLAMILDQSIDEGVTLNVSVLATDPENDPVTLLAAGLPIFAQFTDNGNGNGKLLLNPGYFDAGTFAENRIVASDGSLTDTVSFAITVNNVNRIPQISAIGNRTLNEGDTLTLSCNFTDPDTNNTWSGTVNYGDGSAVQPIQFEPNHTFNLVHPYRDNGRFKLKITVSDNENGAGSDSAEVTVINVRPALSGITAPVAPNQVGSQISASASFTDQGRLDTHTASWLWGDGNSSPGTISEANGSGTVSGSHVYTAAGVFTVNLTLNDKDGASTDTLFRYIVIFDPEGGFVTGGGWITSPPGAYAPDPSLTGKATFGFNSKYKKGATVPSGNTQFEFHAAKMNFHSTEYEWLVVGGPKAKFKGTGTINGTGGYGFMLSAIDGEISGGGGTDKFRIKIWNKVTGSVIYDNQMGLDEDADPATVIGGGNIKIQKD